MKKPLLLIAVIAAAMCANAQGTWFATGTEALIAAGTEMNLGIANLKVIPSDAAGVIGKTDAGATAVTYNGINYENLAMIQGSTNGMYYAFLPSKSGTLDIAIKMGSGKKTFILEVKDEFYTNLPATVGDIAALTTNIPTADGITAQYFTTPSVYDTYNLTNGIWDGTVAMQSTGANVYLVASFPVTANKTYAVGCFGSKLMLRAATLTTTTNVSNISVPEFKIFPNPASGKFYMSVNRPTEIGIYSMTGQLVKQQLVASSKNYVNLSEIHSGVYFVKTMNNNSQTQKLIVR